MLLPECYPLILYSLFSIETYPKTSLVSILPNITNVHEVLNRMLPSADYEIQVVNSIAVFLPLSVCTIRSIMQVKIACQPVSREFCGLKHGSFLFKQMRSPFYDTEFFILRILHFSYSFVTNLD